MSSNFGKQVLLSALTLVLVAIWIRNLMLLLPEEQSADSQTRDFHQTGDTTGSSAVKRAIQFSFVSTDRDPFAMPAKQSTASRKRALQDRPVPHVESLHASLQGFVWEKKAPCVIVFDSTLSKSALYRHGDSLGGYRLVQVTKDKAVWKSKAGRKIVWETSE